jgi:hypothetical protein
MDAIPDSRSLISTKTNQVLRSIIVRIVAALRPRRFCREDPRPFKTSCTCVGIVERNDSRWIHRIVDASRKEPIRTSSGGHPV